MNASSLGTYCHLLKICGDIGHGVEEALATMLVAGSNVKTAASDKK